MDLIQNIDDRELTSINSQIDGRISRYAIGNNLYFTEFDFRTLKNMSVPLNNTGLPALYFIYNLKSDINLLFPEIHSKKHLEAFQSAVVYSRNRSSTKLTFQAKGKYNVGVITLLKTQPKNDEVSLFSQFENLFLEMGQHDSFMDSCLPNLRNFEFVRKLLEMPKNSMSNNLMASGYLHLIMSIKLKEYQEGIAYPKYLKFLTSREIQQIHMIANQISKNPELPYSIDSFCKESGLSPSKLQDGFKEMYNRTVTNYIIHMRLKKAEELLKNGDLNISQIVYSIGLSSRSYFSRIFKQKYNCTPKDYQQQLYSLAVTA